MTRGDVDMSNHGQGVKTAIPRMTKVAWHLKRDEIQNSHPSETKKEFVYNISNSEYRKDWGNVYEKPGFVARLKAFFLRVVPKVGPFSGLAFHPPPPAVEQLYMSSFNETLVHYPPLLLAQQERRPQFPNDTLPTPTLPAHSPSTPPYTPPHTLLP